jgi:quercetin dioxygenase-like cupin family protein
MRISEFPAGFHGPVHKQPYPRYAYLMSGRLRVTYDDQKVVKEFTAGDFMVEGIDQWHSVEAIGPEAVKVLVIDQTPPGAPNVVIKGR